MNTWDDKAVCRFVRAHYRPWAISPLESIREYFAWFAMMNLLGVVRLEDRVIAVATFRTFHTPSDYRKEFVHDPAGQYVRINLYGALHPAAFAVLFGQLAQKQDLKGRTFLWHRDVEELGPPRERSLEQMIRLAEKCLRYERRVSTNTTEPYSVCASTS